MLKNKKTLLKGKDIIGLKVVDLQNGHEIDDVDELVYDPKENKVKALVIDPGGWFENARVILFEDIKTIGEDVVIIDTDQKVKKASDVAQNITRILKEDNYLTDNKVITDSGMDLGRISDIYFEPKSGKVVEFEVDQGIVNKIQSGKKRFKTRDITKVGEDVTIVKAYVEESLERQANKQGLKGFGQSIEEKAPNILEAAKEKIEEVKNDPATVNRLDKLKINANNAKNNFLKKAEITKEDAMRKAKAGKKQLDESRKKGVLGKYVTVNILSTTDEIIAKRGTMVTHKILKAAEENGMLEAVLGNTSREPLGDSK